MHLRCLLVLLVATSWANSAAAKPVRDRTPLHARPAEVEVMVLGIDLGRFRSPDLRRIEPEMAGLVAEELTQNGYTVRDAKDAVSSEDKRAGPAHALAGEVAAFDCTERSGKTCGIVIEWALIDFDSGAVTYRVKTSHEETDLAALGKGDAARAVVRGAIRSLLARTKFEAAVADPRDVYRTRLPPASIRACGGDKLEMPKDAEQVLGATVVVRTPDGVGSAVSVSPDGYLLTAAHVVSGYEKKGVTVVPRGGKELRATVVRYDESSDVALLKLDAGGPTVAACLALSQTAAKAGEEVYVVGAPAGEELSFSMSRGILSGRRHLYGNEYLQTDASINPGNSGGPLLSETAGVLGIVSWKMSGQALEGLGFAVEIDSALKALSLSTAASTTAELDRERARTNVLAKPLVDAADPPWQVVGQAGSDGGARPGGGGSSEFVGILRGTGLLALVLGSTTIVISAVANSGNTSDPGAYYTARTYNDIGWVVAGVGAAAVATSFVIPLFGKDDPAQASVPRRHGLGLRAGLGGAGVRLGLEVLP